MPERRCAECGASIDTRRADAVTCSGACRARATRRRSAARHERERAVAAEALAVLEGLASPRS